MAFFTPMPQLACYHASMLCVCVQYVLGCLMECTYFYVLVFSALDYMQGELKCFLDSCQKQSLTVLS